MEYRFSLDHGSKKWPCPSCDKKTFVKYVDQEKKEYLADHVGRCDREINCQYHYPPKLYFQSQLEPNKTLVFKKIAATTKQPKKAVSYIPNKLMEQSLKGYDKNNFYQYLVNQLGVEVASTLSNTFKIGTSKHWKGANIFWQVDHLGKVRTGKVMLYDTNNGKRVKKPFNHIHWVHSILQKQSTQKYYLNQCLFGLHQLNTNGTSKVIAIVESEKTAILMTAFMPQYIWMATGGLSNLSLDKFEPLRYRKLILYPDLNAFDKWQDKIQDLKALNCQIKISNLLEAMASTKEKNQGYDLADYLV